MLFNKYDVVIMVEKKNFLYRFSDIIVLVYMSVVRYYVYYIWMKS